MEVHYREATIDDIDFLVHSRLDFIDVHSTDMNYELIKGNLYLYFSSSLTEDKCNVVLAEVNKCVVGTGIVFYYDSVPSLFNPSGKNAYITSMFVNENYRRNGIATNILDRLVNIVKAKDCPAIFLAASAEGRPLYKKYGFCDSLQGMYIKL